ncbi:MAG: F0F1 ATP synthase subunit delta [Clostridium sartagoforme]|nr:F0F1 ATP synthase subunit delta [Clostridium sartagoforme]
MYEHLDRRYALALYEVAEEKGKVQQYMQDLREICNIIDTNKDFYEVIKQPQISTKMKKRTFINIFKGHIDEELLSFLLILIEKDRILYLKEKLMEMEKIDLERKNTLRGIVKTTIPLTEEELSNLISTLEKKYNKHIILEQIIDKEILGGIFVRINNDVIDGTVKSKLDELKELMTNYERRKELDRKNTLHGVVKTTVPLTEDEFKKLVSSLERKYNKHIVLEQVIDKEILGGIAVSIQDDVIDGTIEAELGKMKKSMFREELR